MRLMFWILDWEEEKFYEFLFMVDFFKVKVDEYLSCGLCFIVEYEGEMVGEFVLFKIWFEIVEIVNIVV